MSEDVPAIDVQAARRRLDEGEPMIDVREEYEYRQVRIPGAVLVPMSEFAARMDELPRDRELMIQCRSGARSASVTRALLQHGFRAVNVAGGILAWQEAGFEVEKE